jgi:predicted GNAT family N-acyltransferase
MIDANRPKNQPADATSENEYGSLFRDIAEIIKESRKQVQQTVNLAMVESYWQIGRLIIEHEQRGESRATYGSRLLAKLSEYLTREFGKGFDITNLRNMRRFYLAFPIRETVSTELSWSHYNVLSRIENPNAREWYQQEAIHAYR